MSEFSSLSGSPLCHFSHKLAKSNIQSEEDVTIDEFESDADAEKDADEHEMLTSNDLASPVQQDIVSTPELRHSWRHTRKYLTAEIDESLVFIEDEDTGSDHNELYNMECSKAISRMNEQIVLHQPPPVNNHRTAPIENIPEASVPILESTTDFPSHSSSDVTANPGAYNNAFIKKDDTICQILKTRTSKHNLNNFKKDEEILETMDVLPVADTDSVLESTSDVVSRSSLEEETVDHDAHNNRSMKSDNATDQNLEARKSVHNLNFSEEAEELLEEMEVASVADNGLVSESTSDVLSRSSFERETDDPDAHNDVSFKKDNATDRNLEARTSVHNLNFSEEDEEILEEMEVAPVADNGPVAESTSDVLCRSSLEEETVDHDAHNDLSMKSDNATDQNLEARKSVHNLNFSEEAEELLEEMAVAPVADNGPVVESTSDVLSRSSFERETDDPDAHNDVSFKKDNATDRNLEARTSVHNLNFSEEDEEILEEMAVAPVADNGPVAESTSDVLCRSALEEETVDHDAHNDPFMKSDNATDQNLEARKSVHNLNFTEETEELLEEMEVASVADNGLVSESTSDVLSRSALEEETVDHDAHNDPFMKSDNATDQNLEARKSVHNLNFSEEAEELLEEMAVAPVADNGLVSESTSDVLSRRETDDPDAHNDVSFKKDNATDRNLEARKSVHNLNFSEDEEILEEMEVAPVADNGPVAESTSDVLCRSSFEKETDDPDAHNDVSFKKDNSTDRNLEARTSVHSLNNVKKDEEILEEMGVTSATENVPVLESISYVVSRSALEEESGNLEANNDASIKRDNSTDRNLEARKSVHNLNFSEEAEEMLEEMEVAPVADNGPVAESTSDVVSRSALEEETVDHDAHNDPFMKSDNATDQNLEARKSVHNLNFSEEAEELLEEMEVAPVADNGPVAESTSDVLSRSSFERETDDPDAHNDVSFKKDNATDRNLEGRTSVHSLNSFKKDEKILEEMEGLPRANNEPVLESNSVGHSTSYLRLEEEMADCDTHSAKKDPTSDLQQVNEDASKTEDHSTEQFPTIDSSLQSVICHEKDDHLQKANVASPEMQQSTPRVSKRRLYSKNIFSSPTLDHTIEEIPRSVSNVEYFGILTTLTHKANKSENAQVDSGDKVTRKNLPKRACREKIVNLSEKFLSGPSPVPKLVKSKLIDQDTQHDDTNEHHDKTIVIDEQSVIQNPPKPTVARKGRSRKKAPETDVSVLQQLDSISVTEGETAIVNNVFLGQTKSQNDTSVGVRRGRGRKKAPAAEDSVSKQSDAVPVTDGEDISDKNLLLEQTKTQNDTPVGVRRGRGRKKAPAAEDSVLKQSQSVPVTHGEDISDKNLLLEQTKTQNDTPVGVRRGRGRKKAPVAKDSVSKQSDAVPVTDGEDISDKNLLLEQTKTQNDTPVGVRRGRGRKKAPAAEDSVLKQSQSVSVTHGEDISDKNLLLEQTKTQNDTPVGVRRGRGRKKAPAAEDSVLKQSQSVPVTHGEDISDKNLLLEQTKTQNDTPVGVRRGRGRKKAPAAEDSVLKQSQSVAVTHGEDISDKNLLLEQTKTQNDTPVGVRRGRGRKKAPAAEDSVLKQSQSVSVTHGEDISDKNLLLEQTKTQNDTPVGVRRGRGRKKAPAAEDSVSKQSDPVSVNDRESTIADNVNFEQKEEMAKDTAAVVRRGRTLKKVVEVSPLRTGRRRKINVDALEDKVMDEIEIPHETKRTRRVV
ncbi:uncharacterized protein LOC128309787 [Anopheles moucheti]|uniref:uncharacterized protein LOC128309787 n=1 Tax=Anopheles moucheti TaxID=186751 RepID=UPI0022F0B1ED|nr:uncharacterized protein LOC128309787 [Anopheles moucheti]